eukprot:SAG31_NODE_6527_length_1988_cov_0.972472_2_plen_49_part_00
MKDKNLDCDDTEAGMPVWCTDLEQKPTVDPKQCCVLCLAAADRMCTSW